MKAEQWSQRLNQEHNWQLKVFKNKIADQLRAGYKEHKNAENIPMTVEMGEVLRIQMGEIYSKLEKLGIPLEEAGE